jgi:hypothetical protein
MHEGERERGVGILHVVGHHEGDGGRDAEVGQEDEEQGGVDGHRDRELGVLRLLATDEKQGDNIYFKKGSPGWGANPGPLDFVYFLIPSIYR